MLWELCVLLFTLAFLLFTFFSVLYLMQLRRTAKNLEIVLNTLNEGLPVIMSKVSSIAGDLSEAAHLIHAQVQSLSQAVQKVDEMVDDVVAFEKSIRRDLEAPIRQTLGTYRAVTRGVQAFVSALLSPR